MTYIKKQNNTPLIARGNVNQTISTEWGLIRYEDFVKKEKGRRRSGVIEYSDDGNVVCLR